MYSCTTECRARPVWNSSWFWILLYSCTPVYSCTHVPCTHIMNIEPDLCPVASAARPAAQFAYQGAVGCLIHIVTEAFPVTNGSDDGVLISVTWEEGTAGVKLAPQSPCYICYMLPCHHVTVSTYFASPIVENSVISLKVAFLVRRLHCELDLL